MSRLSSDVTTLSFNVTTLHFWCSNSEFSSTMQCHDFESRYHDYKMMPQLDSRLCKLVSKFDVATLQVSVVTLLIMS